MDLLVLIDRLDELVHNAKPVPLTDHVRVDKHEIYEIVDQMRAAIPEEIRRAREGEQRASGAADDAELIRAVTAAVESVLRQNIPAIAQAAAAATRAGAPPPPGGPF